MPLRPGGLDRAEIDHAIAALQRVSSLEDLERAIDTIPALHQPVFHAILRQEHLRLRNTNSPHLANFERRYDDLFFLLHERWYLRLVTHARAEYEVNPSTRVGDGNARAFAPSYFASIADLLGAKIPANRGPAYDPAVDSAQIGDELAALLGHPVDLPAYEPTPGTRWCALTVACAGCRRPRFETRAYIVDLVNAPALAAPLRERRMNDTRCPSCGEALSIPMRVWLIEAPGPGDALGALSCVWRLAPTVVSYQPPPGMQREEANDRILEIRFDRLFRSVPWPTADTATQADEATFTTISVSYSVDQLIAMYERARGERDHAAPAEARVIPLAMETLVRELTRKVQSGVLPLHQAIDSALERGKLFGDQWPIVHPGLPREWTGSPLAHLFQSLVGEGVVQARGQAPDACAMFASTAASSLLALGEIGLAEAALARADDWMARTPLGRARDLVAHMVDDIRADLLEALGRYDESAALRSDLKRVPELAGDGRAAQLARLGIASQEALGLYKRGKLGAAINAFRECIDGWEAIVADAKEPDAAMPADASTDRARCLRAGLHGLSGVLANLAASFMTVMDDLLVWQIMRAPDLTDGERSARLAAADANPVAAIARLSDAFPALEPVFGDELSRQRLGEAADGLLRHALSLSEEIDAWEFAGVQAHRLAALHADIGDPRVAEEFAQRAVRHAARAGDHERVWTARAFLADQALKRDDGAAAIDHLEAAARDHMRHEIGLGQHGELLRAASSLSDGAFRAVALGGDPLRAVMIAESMRAAATAAAIVTGMPIQASGRAATESLVRLRREREQIELGLLWKPNDPSARARLVELERDIVLERKRIALRDPRYGRCVDASEIDLASPAALQRTLESLGTNSRWLGSLAVGERIWSWSVGKDGALVQLGAIPTALAPFGERNSNAGGERWSEDALAEVSEALLAPHAASIDALGPDDTLVISVAGSLQHVPFAALPWRGRRLCERVTPVIVHGFGMFDAALQRPPLEFRSFALLGGPKRADLAPLPGALAEVKAIASLLETAGRSVALASGAKATVQTFAAAAVSNDVIHVACHAVAEPPDGTARLMLAPDLVRGDSGDLSETGIVAEMELKPGCFVNLAGCATGQTRESGSSALGGLVPAFLIAGARSVVASLWPIADAPAARLQEEIYRHIVAGARPAVALAATQRRCAHGELGPELRDPLVWAAYAIYGAT